MIVPPLEPRIPEVQTHVTVRREKCLHCVTDRDAGRTRCLRCGRRLRSGPRIFRKASDLFIAALFLLPWLVWVIPGHTPFVALATACEWTGQYEPALRFARLARAKIDCRADCLTYGLEASEQYDRWIERLENEMRGRRATP